MKTISSPFKAWLKSLPLALGLPAAIWILIWVTSPWRGGNKLTPYEIKGGVTVLGFTVLVHFTAYVVTGLPTFLMGYKKANSPVWIPQVGISFGAGLGALAVSLLFGFQPYSCLMGAAYGAATALAALLQRPNRV